MLIRDNKYIPEVDKDFFILLRIGLWQEVAEGDELSPSPDWEYIYKLACEQTVQGLIADGIGLYRKFVNSELQQFDTLENSELPSFRDFEIPTEWNDRFLSASAQVMRRNWTINQKQAEINQILDARGIQYFVVKGQEAAKNYPKPMLRCSGDIDYLIQFRDFQKVVNILSPIATSIDPYEEKKQDQAFYFGDVDVELHGNVHPSLGSRIDTILDRLQDDMFSGKVTYETFNVVYILLHALQHYQWTGLGIRQITDWTMLIANANAIDWTRVQAAIKSMCIQQEWNSFLSFAVNYLGLELPETRNLKPETAKAASALWLTCKQKGNMGHSDIKEYEPNFLKRNVFGLLHAFTSYFSKRKVAPTTSLQHLKLQLTVYRDQFLKIAIAPNR